MHEVLVLNHTGVLEVLHVQFLLEDGDYRDLIIWDNELLHELTIVVLPLEVITGHLDCITQELLP
jgi:hypothetical protein